MILGFSYFHPLKGECPNTLPIYSNDIVHRARGLLRERSIAELKRITKGINWIINHELITEKLLTDIGIEAENEENGIETNYKGNTFTSIYKLRYYQQTFTLPDTRIQNLQWHEIYATLALTLIDRAIDDEKYYESWQDVNEWLHDYRILSHSATWLIEAMEAITTAEGLQRTQDSINDEKQKIRIRNTAAAIQRHASTNEAIIDLEKLYATGSYKSMRNAAQIFCENYPEKVKHLAHYNRVRTLTDGLSAYLKGKRRSLQAT